LAVRAAWVAPSAPRVHRPGALPPHGGTHGPKRIPLDRRSGRGIRRPWVRKFVRCCPDCPRPAGREARIAHQRQLPRRKTCRSSTIRFFLSALKPNVRLASRPSCSLLREQRSPPVTDTRVRLETHVSHRKQSTGVHIQSIQSAHTRFHQIFDYRAKYGSWFHQSRLTSAGSPARFARWGATRHDSRPRSASIPALETGILHRPIDATPATLRRKGSAR
jgi:hypothetical protein